MTSASSRTCSARVRSFCNTHSPHQWPPPLGSCVIPPSPSGHIRPCHPVAPPTCVQPALGQVLGAVQSLEITRDLSLISTDLPKDPCCLPYLGHRATCECRAASGEGEQQPSWKYRPWCSVLVRSFSVTAQHVITTGSPRGLTLSFLAWPSHVPCFRDTSFSTPHACQMAQFRHYHGATPCRGDGLELLCGCFMPVAACLPVREARPLTAGLHRPGESAGFATLFKGCFEGRLPLLDALLAPEERPTRVYEGQGQGQG